MVLRQSSEFILCSVLDALDTARQACLCVTKHTYDTEKSKILQDVKSRKFYRVFYLLSVNFLFSFEKTLNIVLFMPNMVKTDILNSLDFALLHTEDAARAFHIFVDYPMLLDILDYLPIYSESIADLRIFTNETIAYVTFTRKAVTRA